MALGCSRMIRGLKRANKTFEEIDLEEALKGLAIDMDQFIDLCILVSLKLHDYSKCGSDYGAKIEGIGPVNALKLIKEHKSMEAIVDFLKKKNNVAEFYIEIKKQKVVVPENFKYQEVRNIFKNPKVLPQEEIKVELI